MKEAILTTMALMPFHFLGDWAFQGTYTAMNKAKNWKIRTNHVVWYTVWIMLGFALLGLIPKQSIVAFLIPLAIAIPHWLIDTYKPVKWWVYNIQADNHAMDNETFKKSFENPRQLLMYVVLDQLFHFLTLLPIVVIALWQSCD